MFFFILDLGGRLMSMMQLLLKKFLESCKSQLRERRRVREVGFGSSYVYNPHARLVQFSAMAQVKACAKLSEPLGSVSKYRDNGELSHYFGEWQGLDRREVGWLFEKFDARVSLAGLWKSQFRD